jgi:membrane protein YdbS with pleckstrin-like domain
MFTYQPKKTFLTKNLIIVVLVVIGTWACLYFPLYFILREERVIDYASKALFWSIVPNLVWGLPLFLSMFPVYKRYRYELLDDEIVVHSGWLVQKVRHVPYRMVTNIEVKRGLLDRWLGIGTLNVETAGNSDPSKQAEARLQGLEDVYAVYEEVAACLRAFDEAQQSQPWGRTRRAATAADADGEEDVLQAILAELKGIRAEM